MFLILLWLIFVRIIKVLLFFAYSNKKYGKIASGSYFFNVFSLVQDSTVSYCCSTLVRTVCMTHIALQTFVWLFKKTISVHFYNDFSALKCLKHIILVVPSAQKDLFWHQKWLKIKTGAKRRHFQKFGDHIWEKKRH